MLSPEIIYIDARVRGLSATQRILANLPGVHTELIADLRTLQIPTEFSRAKQQWLITQSPKKWYRRSEPAGGTTRLLVDFVTNAPYDCSYSPFPVVIAQRPFLTILVNVEEALADLGRRCAATPGQRYILRCGEYGDALAIDHLTHTAETLIPFFAWTPNTALELWTRTANVGHLRQVPHHGHTTITFGVTPQRVIAAEERDATPLEDRLAAAASMAAQGYRIAYAIDPILQYEGWQHDYEALLDVLLAATPRGALERIELSCFHYPRGLVTPSLSRFPETLIFFGELVPVNGCYRYFRPVRQQMYRYLTEAIRRRDDGLPVQITQEHSRLALG